MQQFLHVDASNSSVYRTESTAFWSWTEWLDPTCVFLPRTTEEVSQAVSIFTEYGCPFAIRGGGHSAVRGAANIEDGILVSMRRIKDITFSEDKRTVSIGAGNTWAEVYNAVEPHGFMVVGGRFAPVGMGLALGAGFSYFTNDLGLAVDNVAGQRVVLANGTVVVASAEAHQDLHWALKGGSNNFGVVTHFILETVPHPGLYGGRVTYPPSSLDAVQKVTYDYQVKTAPEHRDVHVLPTYIYDSVSNTTYGYSPLAYLKNATALPASLQPWLDIEHTNSTIRGRTYGNLAEELAAGFPDGLVQSLYTFTVYPSESYLKFALERFHEFCSGFSHIEGLAGLQTIMPIPPQAIEKASGNNPLGLERARPGTSLTVVGLGLQFNNEEDIDEVFPAWDIFIRDLQLEAKSQDLLFPFIMLTYADGNQQAIASYGDESVERLQEVSAAYDPDMVFQRLVNGGQKLPLFS
ncbi:hypothetical protein DL770_010766 [Monosporascus sp. CRB-9-2]|nr:hypothetical protein DL770_010766 [Monosporascus sp. CRB-9-2]